MGPYLCSADWNPQLISKREEAEKADKSEYIPREKKKKEKVGGTGGFWFGSY